MTIYGTQIKNPNFLDLLDANNMLIGFDNGIVDLRTRTFRSGRTTDFVSYSVNEDFIPDLDPDKVLEIEEFFRTIQPDASEEFMDYMASCLTGQNENCVFLGGCGKNAMIELFELVLGDYLHGDLMDGYERKRLAIEYDAPIEELIKGYPCPVLLFNQVPQYMAGVRTFEFSNQMVVLREELIQTLISYLLQRSGPITVDDGSVDLVSLAEEYKSSYSLKKFHQLLKEADEEKYDEMKDQLHKKYMINCDMNLEFSDLMKWIQWKNNDETVTFQEVYAIYTMFSFSCNFDALDGEVLKCVQMTEDDRVFIRDKIIAQTDVENFMESYNEACEVCSLDEFVGCYFSRYDVTFEDMMKTIERSDNRKLALEAMKPHVPAHDYGKLSGFLNSGYCRLPYDLSYERFVEETRYEQNCLRMHELHDSGVSADEYVKWIMSMEGVELDALSHAPILNWPGSFVRSVQNKLLTHSNVSLRVYALGLRLIVPNFETVESQYLKPLFQTYDVRFDQVIDYLKCGQTDPTIQKLTNFMSPYLSMVSWKPFSTYHGWYTMHIDNFEPNYLLECVETMAEEMYLEKTCVSSDKIYMVLFSHWMAGRKTRDDYPIWKAGFRPSIREQLELFEHMSSLTSYLQKRIIELVYGEQMVFEKVEHRGMLGKMKWYEGDEDGDWDSYDEEDSD